MDALTWLSLGLQFAALCSIVGALLLYLLRKVRVAEVLPVDSAKTVLVTSVDTALGLQVSDNFQNFFRKVVVFGKCQIPPKFN